MASNSSAAVLAAVAALLPRCYDVVAGPCYMEAPQNGFVVYDETYKLCLNSFIIVPGWSLLPHWFLGALYILFTIYLFLGVAIASDLFMESVEQITATTKTITRTLPDGREVTFEEPVWNWVVANITLMAVGSSSPEIVLALMDCVLELGKPDGSQLGPSTIVGSGAFNLLVITAACTISINNGAYKRIEQLRVFLFTMLFQFWAHFWMLIVYRWWTPDIISLAEALITLAFFPVLVLGAWLMDTQPWQTNKVTALDTEDNDDVKQHEMSLKPGASVAQTPRGVSTMRGELTMGSRTSKIGPLGGNATMDTRRRTARAITGRFLAGRRAATVNPREDALLLEEEEDEKQEKSTVNMLASMHKMPTQQQKVLFKSAAYSVLESMGVAKVSVIRCDGDMESVISVAYATVEDTACGGLDFEHTKGILTFQPGEDTKEICISIVDDDLSEPDVMFWVQISTVENGGNLIIIQDKVQVTIVDDDQNGVLSFELPHHEASTLEAVVPVVRRLGSDGTVTVGFRTVDGTALAGVDYVFSEGTLVFEAKTIVQVVRVPIIMFSEIGIHKTFKLVLDGVDGGGELGKRTQCRVTIIRRRDSFTRMPLLQPLATGKPEVAFKLTRDLPEDKDKPKPFNIWSSYTEQFSSVIVVPEPEEGETLGALQIMMHYCTITWRLFFAIVPSPDYKGGYPAFVGSLGMLALVVFLLVETTHMLGCVVNLLPVVNGYSIVALGTSLPDTFAARIAAMHEPSADAAIGSVMGSNSVNVFLGLGLPWLLGSLYSIAKGEKYHQPGGDLFFSVLVFVCVAAVGVAIMMYCRFKGGELGGPPRVRVTAAAAYVGLWIVFLVLSGMRAYGTL